MKHIKITKQNIDPAYRDLFIFLYRKEKNLDFFLEDLECSIDYTIAQKNIVSVALFDNKKIIGHITLIYNKNSSYFGFFDLQGNSKKDFALLWNALKKEARKLKINKIAGPINGSIWFPYRVIEASDNSALFKGELPTLPSYSKLFYSLPNTIPTSYYSSAREKFNVIMSSTKEDYEKMLHSDFSIETSTKVSKGLLKKLHTLAEKVFSQSVGYEALSLKYFEKLYNKSKLETLLKVYTVEKQKNVLAFCSVFKEDRNTLIFKTIAVHPDFQKQGIGNAIVHIVHKDAQKAKFKKIIYALIRSDNAIKRFPKDDAYEVRRYSIFQVKI